MQNNNYLKTAIEVFSSLQRKYKFTLVEKENVLNYSNNICNFSVYFEKYFEFYICFHVNNMDLRLYDIIVWLGFENNDIAFVAKNQFANHNNAKQVLENLQTVLVKLLVILQQKPKILFEFLENQKAKRKDTVSKHNLSLLQQAWESKEFALFLKLVEENRAVIKDTNRAELIFKQEAYIKNKTGDGSMS